MLTVNGPSTRYCDGISRRSALRIGALGFGAGALTLADLYRAEGSTGGRHKSVINIFLGGGPPHQDMWDIKTDAPPEIRGPFKPIATNVAGIEIGEVFPQIAAIMDKSVVIRSVVGTSTISLPSAVAPAWVPSPPKCWVRSIGRCLHLSASPMLASGRTLADLASSARPSVAFSPTAKAWRT